MDLFAKTSGLVISRELQTWGDVSLTGHRLRHSPHKPGLLVAQLIKKICTGRRLVRILVEKDL